MRTLVYCDDRWHPGETVRAGLQPLAAHGFEFDFVEDPTAAGAADPRRYRLLVLAKSNNISALDETPWAAPSTLQTQQAIADAVRGGVGLLVLHSGLADYDTAPLLRSLLGGVFVHHPPQCAVTVEPQAMHALTGSVKPFTVIDEHYFIQLDDPDADVFLTTSSEHGCQPGGWSRRFGQGRVVVLSPGHTLEVWLHPAYQQLVLNGLQACSSEE